MMRVAVVHDWLVGMRGGERVLEGILDLFPHAEIFTLFHVPGSVSSAIERHRIHESPLRLAPFVERGYRRYLPLMPLAIRAMRVDGFDLVISSSHCVAKAVWCPGIPHLCYCHTPMRYVWDQFDAYFSTSSPLERLTRAAASSLARALRRWDAATAGRVSAFVANSAHVRGRIRACYGRDAAIVYPPVELGRFRAARRPEDFYLVVSALVPYKKIDLAIDACARLGRPLVIVGDGPEIGKLRRIAGGDVTFAGRIPDTAVAELYSRCRALLFPGIEDFGITAVEAQAAGAPVIALGIGGVLESIVGPMVDVAGEIMEDGRSPRDPTGVFFSAPTAAAMAAGIRHAEGIAFDERAIRQNAERFAPTEFHEGLLREITGMLARRESAKRPALALGIP